MKPVAPLSSIRTSPWIIECGHYTYPARPAAPGIEVSLTIVVGVVVAALAWGAMFSLGRRWFWARAAGAGAVIAVYAILAGPARIGDLIDHGNGLVNAAIGLASGIGLYAVFWIGEQLLVILVPALASEVEDLYAVRGAAGPVAMVAVLVAAASGEELFFRGLLQTRIGFVAALAIYGAVHIWERKVILTLAALAAGAWWGALLALTGGLVAPLVSHVVWCMLIIVWRPARATEAARRIGRRLRPAAPGSGPAVGRAVVRPPWTTSLR
jgi:uncharacterized protein